MTLDHLYILRINEKKLLKKNIKKFNEFTKNIKQNRTTFLNFENSFSTSDHERVLLNLSDKTNLNRSDKYVVLSNLSVYYA